MKRFIVDLVVAINQVRYTAVPMLQEVAQEKAFVPMSGFGKNATSDPLISFVPLLTSRLSIVRTLDEGNEREVDLN